MGFEEDYIHGMRCYQITTREFVTTNHLRVVATSDEYQLCPNDWPHIAKDTGSGKLGSLEEVPKSKPVTDFQYLIDTYHLDDEDGLLYKVTRVGKYKNYIVCWRRLVLSDGTLHKEDKLPIHAQDVADLTDLTGATLPTNSPLKPNNITWQDRSSVKNDTSGLEANGEGSAKDLPQSHSREIPSDYGKLTNGRRSSQSEHKKEVDLAPTGNKRKLDSRTPQAKTETRNHLSRSCNLPKNCDQPTFTPAPTASVSMGPKLLNRLSTTIQYGNIFCKLAFIAFTAMITMGNPEVYLSTTYLPPDPTTHRQAMNSKDREDWLEAEAREFRSLLENGVFSEMRLPPGRRTVRTKWVYKLKRDKDGEIAKYKARLVAQGFTQIEGIDYTQTYSPVARFTFIRTMLALCAIFGYQVHQMDVETAFFNGTLKEEIYIVPPEGWPVAKGNVLKLNKALYGLE